MSFSTCPITIVDAPVDQVWRLLADPARYALWWDAQTRSINPEGAAQPGQQIFAQTVGLGTRWDVHVTVQAVMPEKQQIALRTRLPLGITVHNQATCVSIDGQHTRVSFG
jgi:hypothetical protein